MVIDNASPDGSGKLLAQKANEYGFIFFENKQNNGYAAGNNIGLRYAFEKGYDYAWILNSDVLVKDADCLKKMIAVGEECNRVACIGPQIVDLNGNYTFPYLTRPTMWMLTFGEFFEKKHRKKYVGVSGEVYRVHGCSILLKVPTIASVGYLDERTFLYREEEILAEKLLSKGYICYYCANTRVTHLESASVKTSLKKDRKKLSIILDSAAIYLRDYREFSFFSFAIYKIYRTMKFYLRG